MPFLNVQLFQAAAIVKTSSGTCLKLVPLKNKFKPECHLVRNISCTIRHCSDPLELACSQVIASVGHPDLMTHPPAVGTSIDEEAGEAQLWEISNVLQAISKNLMDVANILRSLIPVHRSSTIPMPYPCRCEGGSNHSTYSTLTSSDSFSAAAAV